MQNIYGIYGASGFGKEVLPLVRKQISDDSKIVFIDDSKTMETLLGYDILNFDDFLKINGKKFVTIAIANSKIRERLTQKCISFDINIVDVRANNIIELENVYLGEGCILSPFVTLTTDIKIGKSFQANIYSYIAHDCIIGDYVTFAPAVKCNGNVHISDHVYIGTGAIIYQGKLNKPLKIGKGAIISAGSVVTKNVAAGVTVFGNPAIPLTKDNLKKRS